MARSLQDWVSARGVSLNALAESAGVELHIVQAIAEGRYTPSPEQRAVLATALGISTAEIAWGHRAQISHVYGHGPQFGRSP
jgi:ribosome-binding protein aMBF1 (putative translation factor)